MLLDGMFLDLENYLKDLMTRSWLGAGTVIDTFIATCEDYGNDFTCLRHSASGSNTVRVCHCCPLSVGTLTYSAIGVNLGQIG